MCHGFYSTSTQRLVGLRKEGHHSLYLCTPISLSRIVLVLIFSRLTESMWNHTAKVQRLEERNTKTVHSVITYVLSLILSFATTGLLWGVKYWITHTRTHARTHTQVTQSFYCSSGICPELPGWAGTRKVKPGRVKPIWIYWSKR